MRQALLVAVFLVWAIDVSAQDRHVRVVLDTSGSMKTYDAPELAKLATLLLYDLAEPNLGVNGSFVVIPFHPTVEWVRPNDPPPTATGERISVQGGRHVLARALGRLEYNAARTYFYPGLLRSIDELERAPGGTDASRVIVLVTDGLPESPTDVVEAKLLQTSIVPRMEKAGIRLYVLAFGKVAAPGRHFFDALVTRPGGNLGEVFPDPTGERLLDHMMAVFSRSFGYTAEPPAILHAPLQLDLRGRHAQSQAAVVVYWLRRQPPGLRLHPPHPAEPIREGGFAEASFALRWVFDPREGRYTLDAASSGARVTVLRPTEVTLTIQPAQQGGQTQSAVATVAVPLRVVASPPAGAAGDPGPVALSYRVRGPRTPEGYAWSEPRRAAPRAGVPGPEGRIYEIAPAFPSNPQGQGDLYTGHLEVQARRGEAVVGALERERAHAVQVHPFVSLTPTPIAADAKADGAVRPLRWDERGCAEFRLALSSGTLPPRSVYSLRALVAPSARSEPQLLGARFALDGHALHERPVPGEWSTGRKLEGTGLLGRHELCVRMGRPRGVDPARPVEVALDLTLLETPYDVFGVVRPFTLRAFVAPPGWWQQWAAWVTLGAASLATLGVLWYGRFRPTLPGDLHVAAARAEGGALAPERLGRGPLVRRLLGLGVEHPVRVEDHLVGWVRPLDRELYDFRAAHGVHLDGASDGGTRLQVHRTYRMRSERGVYLVRLEYL